ncbi:MAG: YfdX family protein [Gammaproteobacteria bacterium]
MKNQKSKIRKAITAAVIPLALALPLTVFATEVAKTAPVISGKNMIDTRKGAAISNAKAAATNNAKVDIQKQIVKEAADAANATHTALKALADNNTKEALAALQVASGNLNILLAQNPALGLMPIDFQVQVLQGPNDLKTIDQLEDKLEDLIDDKRYQDARPIVDSLTDEIRVTTVYLPLATYPAAIDAIVPLVDAGKLYEAKKELIKVLDTLVYVEEITPLPIIRAEDKLDEAFQIEHKGDLSKQATKDKISHLVIDANQDIKVAEALGYGSKDDYEILYDSMDALKKSIGTGGFEGEWSKLKKSISAFKNKIVHPRG